MLAWTFDVYVIITLPYVVTVFFAGMWYNYIHKWDTLPLAYLTLELIVKRDVGQILLNYSVAITMI